MSAAEKQPDDAWRYLLGELPPEEAERVERELLADDAAFEDLLAAEDELFFDYAQGALPPEQRRRFEAVYLADPEGGRRLEGVRPLARSLSPPRRVVSRAWLVAAALVALVLTLRYGPDAFAPVDPVRSITGVGGVRPAPVAPDVVVVSLAPLSPGADPPRVQLVGGTTIVRMRLTVPEGAGPWQLTLEGFESGPRRVPEVPRTVAPTVLEVDVPAAELPEDDYTATLVGPAGASQTHTFVLLRD